MAEARIRPAPRQERSRQRRAAILDAAEGVIEKVGYEAATTEEISRRAGTSIGSLYRYFPNKEALVEALVERYLDRLRALHRETLSHDTARLSLGEVLDRVINGLVELKSAYPGFWPILHCGSPAAQPAAAGELHRELRERVQDVFAVRAPGMDASELALYAEVTVQVVEALLPLALDSDPQRRTHLLAEMKRLLTSYLGPLIGTDRLPAE
jgi:AcrR family transcriptional regulator